MFINTPQLDLQPATNRSRKDFSSVQHRVISQHFKHTDRVSRWTLQTLIISTTRNAWLFGDTALFPQSQLMSTGVVCSSFWLLPSFSCAEFHQLANDPITHIFRLAIPESSRRPATHDRYWPTRKENCCYSYCIIIISSGVLRRRLVHSRRTHTDKCHAGDGQMGPARYWAFVAAAAGGGGDTRSHSPISFAIDTQKHNTQPVGDREREDVVRRGKKYKKD